MKKQVMTFVWAVVFCVVGTLIYAGDNEMPSIPVAVSNAIAKLFPGGIIEGITEETEGIEVYEVEVEGEGIEGEVTVTADGAVVEQEIEVEFDALPRMIKASLLKLADTDEIEEVKQETVYYEVVLKKLKTPRIAYEAEVELDGQEVIVELNSEGKIVKREVEQDEDRSAKADGDEEDEGPDDDGEEG